MSGLFGYFGAADAPLEIAQRMGARMCHTPRMRTDAAQVAPDGAIGRISIGLLNAAPQPVRAGDDGCALWLCGEFYHADEQRRALVHAGLLEAGADDSALALATFRRDGAAGLAQLNGAFVAAVWEPASEKLTLVNDRFGLYPHYYSTAGGAFVFAPEIKGVVAAPAIPRRVDLTAVAEYSRFQQLLGERTWLEDVHLLPRGSILRFDVRSRRLEQTRYWDWDAIQPAPPMRFGEAAEETGRLFQRAVDAMIQPPLRVGVYLSGGLDGRTILGCIPPQTPVATVTYGQEGCRDVLYAAQLAQRAGRPHRWFPFAGGRWVEEQSALHLALTEGMHGWMHGHGMSTLDEAAALMDVNLSGWDGGTTLGGRMDEYATDHALRHPPDEAARAARLYAAFCHTLTWPGLTDDEAAALAAPPGRADLPARAHASFDDAVAATAHYPQPYRSDFFYIDQHVLRSTHSMIVFQRAVMEVRCPYFDYALMDFLYSLPETIFAGPRLHRTVLTQRAPALARVPNEKDNRLPHSSSLMRGAHASYHRAQRAAARLAGRPIVDRPRLYADYETYLRTDLRAWAEAILFDERTLARGFFNPSAVRALWERHLRGDELWTIGKIAPLITIELVMRSLLDESTQLEVHPPVHAM